MANKKLNRKGLILFFIGFFLFSVAALGVGFFVLPLLFDSSAPSSVVVEELPQQKTTTKETVVEVEQNKPNTSFAVKEGSLSVECEQQARQEGKRVDVFLEKETACMIISSDKKSKIQAKTEVEYICFIDNFSSCRTMKEQEEAETEAAKKEAEEQAKKIASVSNKTSKDAQVKKEAPIASSRLKNEADIIVTGPAIINISADIDAIVFVDGKKIRKAPLFKYDVSPGVHKVVIVAEGDFSNKKEFTLDTESGMNYIRQWSFQNNTWLKKIP